MKNYSNRQKKIYSDYSPKSDNELLTIIDNKNRYLSEIIDVVIDILIERGMINSDYKYKTENKEEEILVQEKLMDAYKSYEKDKNPYYSIMCSYSNEELMEIIKLSNEYQSFAIIAAIRLAIERKHLSEAQGYGIIKMLDENEYQRGEVIEQEKVIAKKKVPYGVIILLVGIMFTAITNGNYIFYGAIIVGLGIIIRNAFQ